MLNSGVVPAALLSVFGFQDLSASILLSAQQPGVSLTDTTVAVVLSRPVDVAADRASAWVVIDATGETPASALSRLQERQEAVVDTLRSWSGRLTAQGPTPHGVALNATQGYVNTPQAPSYVARSLIRITNLRVNEVPPLEAALLSAGAGPLSGVTYESTATDSVFRQKALEMALAADSMAVAFARQHGKRLGPLMDASITTPFQSYNPQPMSFDLRGGTASRSAPMVTFTVTVTRRHRLLPAG